MSAAEPLDPTPAEQAVMDQLNARIDELNQQIADLTYERDAARRTCGKQQTEFQEWRLRPAPRPARHIVRDVPTGELT